MLHEVKGMMSGIINNFTDVNIENDERFDIDFAEEFLSEAV